MKYRLRKPHAFHSAGLTQLYYLPVLKACEFVTPGIEIFCEPFRVTMSLPDKLTFVKMMRLGTLSALSIFFFFSTFPACFLMKNVQILDQLD